MGRNHEMSRLADHGDLCSRQPRQEFVGALDRGVTVATPMEDRDFFPAALKALEPQDWTEIASTLTSRKDPLFSEVAEKRFYALRAHILQSEQEAEAERH
jgi:hypothetical protein